MVGGCAMVCVVRGARPLLLSPCNTPHKLSYSHIYIWEYVYIYSTYTPHTLPVYSIDTPFLLHIYRHNSFLGQRQRTTQCEVVQGLA